MKKKKVLISILGIITTLLVVLTTLLFLGVFDRPKEIINEEPPVVIINAQPQRQLWLDNKAINDDYIGEIVFDSNLINISFVQAKDVYDKNGNLYHFYTEHGDEVKDASNYCGNDVYIWTNWKDMSYDYNILGGSVFMDYRNELNDQNIIIYGHHFSQAGGNDPDRVKAFTPLEKLMEEDNYKDNNVLKLILDNETRTYELLGVYKFDIKNEFYTEKLQYYRRQYNYDEFEEKEDSDYYQKYIDAFNEVKLYDTGVEFNTNDSTLTLQTCISGLDGSVYEICVFKLVNIEKFD